MRFKEQRAIRRRRKNPGHFKTRLFLKGRLGNKETRAKILKEFKPRLAKFDTDKMNFEPILATTKNRNIGYEYFYQF